MKFILIASENEDSAALEADYGTAREIGVLRIGEMGLFFRSGFKKYYIPYTSVTRVFRRVLAVPAKLCCGRGNFEIENLVVAQGDRELAQIQLPGARAAEEVMKIMKIKLPDADFTAIHADPDTVKQGTVIGS